MVRNPHVLLAPTAVTASVTRTCTRTLRAGRPSTAWHPAARRIGIRAATSLGRNDTTSRPGREEERIDQW